ncbi:MAG: hypothetical protein LBD17_02695 [Endomicrobium sp.]|jgi:hypothetical protein|nr:hypothetical protein [Endomicrobium sp.]
MSLFDLEKEKEALREKILEADDTKDENLKKSLQNKRIKLNEKIKERREEIEQMCYSNNIEVCAYLNSESIDFTYSYCDCFAEKSVKDKNGKEHYIHLYSLDKDKQDFIMEKVIPKIIDIKEKK